MNVKVLRALSYTLYLISWLFVVATVIMYFNIETLRKEYGIFSLLNFARSWTGVGFTLLILFLFILGIYYWYNKRRLKRLSIEIEDLQHKLNRQIRKKEN